MGRKTVGNKVWFTPDGKHVFVALNPTGNEMICDINVWEDAKNYTWHEWHGRVLRYLTGGNKAKFFEQQYFGGKRVYHKNGDKLDCRLDNLSNKMVREDEEFEN